MRKPRFRDLSRGEQEVVSEIGAEMNHDTAILFYLLDDDTLYTSGLAAATRYNKAIDPKGFHRMRARIVSFTTYRKMTDDPDGKIRGKSAWYGRTFKAAMGDRSYFRAELHLQLLGALFHVEVNRNAAPTSYPSPVATTSSKASSPVPSTPGPVPAPKPSRPRAPIPWFRLSLLVFLTLLTIMSWLYVTGRLPFGYSGSNERLAMLACYQDSVGTVLRDMVSESIAQTGRIKALSGDLQEKEIGPYSLCDQPNEKVLRRLFEDLEVSYLIWGVTSERGREYYWEGSLIHHNGDQRVIRVTAAGYRDLANEIVGKCLELMGSEESAPSPVGLYSANMNASFLYSEANVHFGNGNIVAAGANYQRAGTVFDPGFYMARIKWAQCLHIQGRLPEARSVLEALLDSESGLSSTINVQASKTLARVYFDNHELDKLEQLLLDAEDLTLTAEDRLFFFQLKAQTLFLRDNWEEATRLADQARKLTHDTITPQTRIEVLLTFAWLASHGPTSAKAFDILDQAQSLARSHDLPSLEITVLGERAHLLLETGDLEQLASFRPNMDEAGSLADRSGNAWDQVELAYWKGRLDSALGRHEEAVYHYYQAATEAEKSGIIEFELKAKVALMRQRLTENNLLEARRLLETLETRIEQVPPKYQLLYYDAAYALNLEREQYLLALDAITSFQQIAEDQKNSDVKALALNKKGWALYRMSRLDVAEKAWFMALELKSAYEPAILKNLIMLNEDRGNAKLANRYRNRLESASRSEQLPTRKAN